MNEKNSMLQNTVREISIDCLLNERRPDFKNTCFSGVER